MNAAYRFGATSGIARPTDGHVVQQPSVGNVQAELALLSTHGACAGTTDDDLFFTDEGESAALAVCHGCPVAPRCLSLALEQDWTDGVWGGLTAQQREDHRAGLTVAA